MILQGQLSVGSFDFIFSSGLLHAQDTVQRLSTTQRTEKTKLLRSSREYHQRLGHSEVLVSRRHPASITYSSLSGSSLRFRSLFFFMSERWMDEEDQREYRRKIPAMLQKFCLVMFSRGSRFHAFRLERKDRTGKSTGNLWKNTNSLPKQVQNGPFNWGPPTFNHCN